MKENNKGNGNTIAIILITIILLTLIGVFAYFTMSRMDKMENSISKIQKTISSPSYATNTSTPSNIEENSSPAKNTTIKEYPIKLKKEKGTKKDYKIDEDFTIHTEIANDNEDFPNLKFTVNNNKTVFEDTLLFSDSKNDDENSFTYNFYRAGNYLVYENHDATSVRSTSLFFIDKSGNLYKELHELDKLNDGLVIGEVKFKEDSIVIEATRITNGPAVIYNQINTDSAEDKKLINTIPKDTTVEATYTYNLKLDGSIDFENPMIKVESTFQDFLNEYKDILNVEEN